MFRMTLLRHAKSSWDHPELRDIDRPLNDRGLRDAPLMGLVCAEKLPPPDLALISPSRRTTETAELFFGSWKNARPQLVHDEELYLAGVREWLHFVNAFREGISHVLLCGHQPGIGNLASWLSRDFDHDVPTGSVFSFVFSDGEVTEGGGRLDFNGRPKDYR